MTKDYYKIIVICFLSIIFFLNGCKDSNENINSGEAYISVTLASSEADNEIIITDKEHKASTKKSLNQNVSLNFSENTKVDFELEETKKSSYNSVKNRSLKGAIDRKPLNPGVRYMLLVYNENGDYVGERIYNYGNENTVEPLKLDAGKKYTFLSFSENTNNTLPQLVDKQKLNTTQVVNVKGDLMVFKKQLTLTHGNNLLNVILKHRFSSILANLSIDPNTTGSFNSITNAFISPTFETANFKFSNESITYNSTNAKGSKLNFPTITSNQRNILSQSSLLISPNTTSGLLKFETISIGDETKSDFLVPNLKIIPGVSYTLKLNFRTCTQNVGSVQGMNWSYAEAFDYLGRSGIWKDNIFYRRGETISKTITAPAADYGFVFDIIRLDNAFNMELNGVKLAKSEIQFEKGASSAQNIRFKDQSLYQGVNKEGGANIDAVYNMIGTSSAPLVKVVISKTGEVRLFGSKVAGGPLYELELFNNNSFNNFPWNNSSQSENKIKITQLVDGRTILIGDGSGKKKIPCK